MEKCNNCIVLLLQIFVLLLSDINAQLSGFRETACSSNNQNSLTISCPGTQTILVTSAIYVKPRFSNALPECEYRAPTAGDLSLDLEMILSYECEGKSDCQLTLEWDIFRGVTHRPAEIWQGEEYFVVEYTCAEADHRRDLPRVPVMVSSRERAAHNVHVYGCHDEAERYPTSVQLDCRDDTIIQIDNAIVGKKIQQVADNGCQSQDILEVLDPSIARDLTFSMTRTVERHCGGATNCHVPVDWPSVTHTVDALTRDLGLYYTGALYLDITYSCVDESSLTSTPVTGADTPGSDVAPGAGAGAGDKEAKPASNGSNDQFPLIALGGIGIAVMVLVTLGIIGFSHYVRRRRFPDMGEFKDVEPTYNTTVMRSAKAPPPKFDNILYEADRHPSGVYDIPRSTTTTPAVSNNMPPDFAIDVRIEMDSDDDDAFESPTNMSLTILFDEPVALPQSPLCQQSQNTYVNNAAPSAPGITAENVNTYADPYVIKTTGSATESKNTYAEPKHDDRRRSSATVESYVTLENGQTKTVLGDKPLVPPQPQRDPPQLPPRTASMFGPKKTNTQDKQIITPKSNSINIQENTMQPSASSHNVLASTSQESHNQTESQTQPSQYANVHKPDARRVHISDSPPTIEYQNDNIESPSSEYDTPSEYYRSMLRHQPVSGVYDNNMDNLPTSPHCLGQLNQYTL